MTRHVPICRRFGNRQKAQNYTADDRAALAARVILRIFDQSNDVLGEIEAVLRTEFAEVARHG